MLTDVPVIDAHFHSWQLARGDYGWLTPRKGAIYRDVAVRDWQNVAAPLGIHSGVLVQAAPTEAETLHLLALADVYLCVQGVVGWVNLIAPDAVQRIEALAQQPLFKGLRPMLHDIADPDWILQSAVQAPLEAMAHLGLVFDALIRPVHLPRMMVLAQRHPTLRIVIDHAAKPDIASHQWQPWASKMQRLAAETAACCKLSGLLTEAGPQPVVQAHRPYSQHVLDCFGAQRVIWGSDWPVLELASDYAPWWHECQAFCAALDAPQRAAIFGGNATRVYRL
jgi:L-fuconolactonase